MHLTAQLKEIGIKRSLSKGKHMKQALNVFLALSNEAFVIFRRPALILDQDIVAGPLTILHDASRKTSAALWLQRHTRQISSRAYRNGNVLQSSLVFFDACTVVIKFNDTLNTRIVGGTNHVCFATELGRCRNVLPGLPQCLLSHSLRGILRVACHHERNHQKHLAGDSLHPSQGNFHSFLVPNRELVLSQCCVPRGFGSPVIVPRSRELCVLLL